MKEIILTQGKVALVDDADYDWLNQRKWFAVKHYNNKFYAARKSYVRGKRINLTMHRVILGLHNSKILGDHADHNGLNNQRSNIRTATSSQNCANRRKSRGVTTSKYLGVSSDKTRKIKQWQFTVTKDNKRYHFGYWKTEQEAAIGYNKKALELHGEFACLNNVVT